MNKSELNACCLYTVAVQDNPIFIGKLLHCDSCKETLRYTGTRWQYEPFEGLCNSAKCKTEHDHDEPPAPRAGERYGFVVFTGRFKVLDYHKANGQQMATADGEEEARIIVRALNAAEQHATLVEQRWL